MKQVITQEDITWLKHLQKVFMGGAYVINVYGKDMLAKGKNTMHPEDLQFITNVQDRARMFINKRIRTLAKDRNMDINDVSMVLDAEFAFPLSVFSLTNTCSFDNGEDANILFNKIKDLVNEHNNKRLEQLSSQQANEIRAEESVIGNGQESSQDLE